MIKPTYRKGFHIKADYRPRSSGSDRGRSSGGQRRAPKMYVERAWPGRWAWHCFLCEPPCSGSTKTFTRTLANALKHLERRSMHHMWAADRRRRARADFYEECGR